MQINNPLPIQTTTIQISGITSPTLFTTPANLVIGNGAFADIAPCANQITVLVSNTSSSGSLNIHDTTTSTSQVGTLLGPGQTAGFDVNATVRVSNASGSSITAGVNQIGR